MLWAAACFSAQGARSLAHGGTSECTSPRQNGYVFYHAPTTAPEHAHSRRDTADYWLEHPNLGSSGDSCVASWHGALTSCAVRAATNHEAAAVPLRRCARRPARSEHSAKGQRAGPSRCGTRLSCAAAQRSAQPWLSCTHRAADGHVHHWPALPSVQPGHRPLSHRNMQQRPGKCCCVCCLYKGRGRLRLDRKAWSQHTDPQMLSRTHLTALTHTTQAPLFPRVPKGSTTSRSERRR